MKQLLFITTILFLALTMAIYPGETLIEEHNLGTDNLVYTIIENSTEINLDVEVNSTHIKIFFPYDIPEDSFKIVFIEEQTNEVIKEVKVSSGSRTRTKVVEKNNIIYLNNTKYIEVEKECDECINKIENKTEVPEEIESETSLLLLLGILGGFLVIIALIISLFSNRSRKEENEFK